jgi:RNA polymerase sigma-70 factor (ECF subfamily)
MAASHGPAMDRLARAYEANAERRRDLLQEIHVALWRSLESFDERCSLTTWIYRVAHNVATSHAVRDRKANARKLITLDELETQPSSDDTEATVEHRKALERLLELVQSLGPVDRQVILLYLEGLDAAAIGEITGLSAGNVATKVHRIKNVLAKRFHGGQRHEQ